jgi:hypothetical protein
MTSNMLTEVPFCSLYQSVNWSQMRMNVAGAQFEQLVLSKLVNKTFFSCGIKCLEGAEELVDLISSKSQMDGLSTRKV